MSALDAGSGGGGAHLLVFPYPASGHIIPLLDLTHYFLRAGFVITVLITPSYRHLLDPLLSVHPSSALQTLLLSAPDTSPSSKFPLVTKINGLSQLSDPISRWFESHASPPVAIVSDFFLGWTHRLARRLGVPRLTFWPNCAFTASITASLWRDLPQKDDGDALVSFSEMPYSPAIPWREVSHLYRGYEEGEQEWEFLRECMLDNFKSWGSVFNSVLELEPLYFDHFKRNLVGHDRVWAVGPIQPPLGDDDDGLVVSSRRGGSTAVSTRELVSWLDEKADDSVVYVCFGSHFMPTDAQIKAIAAALQCSRVNFVWAMKAVDHKGEPHDTTNYGGIPRGLEDRADGRGFVIRGWAPQITILKHRAVGTFLTHCGWNSVSEGLAAGVLMLTWPMAADQFYNAKLLVDLLGVAVSICQGGAQTVPDPIQLAHSLAESVNSTRSKRDRVRLLREAVTLAAEGGSSQNNFNDLVRRLSELSCI